MNVIDIPVNKQFYISSDFQGTISYNNCLTNFFSLPHHRNSRKKIITAT